MRLRAAWAVVLLSCSSSETPPAPPGETPATAGPTFHRDVAPILQKVCQSCHVAGGVAPFPLVTYEHARAVAGSMVTATKSRRMPPWGAQTTAECTPPLPWKGDLRLSDAEIATFEAWQAAGAPEGSPADAPKVAAATPPAALDGALSLAPAPYALTSTRDKIMCFVLDPKLDKTRYLTATHFVPSNATIVHHALAFKVPASAKLHGQDEPGFDPAAPYECFGGPLVPNASLVGAWAPGAAAAQYPETSALPLDAGSRFILQVHYHPHANATPEPDATTFQYRLVDERPTWLAVTQLVGNFEQVPGANTSLPPGTGLLAGPADPAEGPKFLIPAGVNGHVERMQVTIPVGLPELRIASLGAHMHLAGRDEKITLTRASAPNAPECLLHEPSWNFDWQRGYQFDAPIESLPIARSGDVLDLRCTYDNTMENQKLGAALLEASLTQPQPIALGESTTDEMCLAALVFLTKLP